MLTRQFFLALSFLTRIPVPKNQTLEGVTLADSAWAFPLAGAVVGLLAGFAYMAAAALGIPHTPAAWITVGALVLLTGGLHEDGLADMADGLAHGRTREDKLAIMRDSHIGSFGVLALIIVLAIRASALAACTGGAIGWVLIASGMGSRAVMVALMHFQPPARRDGLAALAGRPDQRMTQAALVIGLLPLALSGMGVALAGTMALAATGYGISKTAQKHFGGITGDVLGAAQQVSEALLLALLAH